MNDIIKFKKVFVIKICSLIYTPRLCYLHRSPESCIWRFADFVLERDQEVGVRIFMQPPSGETRPAEWDEKVLNLVQRYPDAHITYLEHVVLENDSQVEKYHPQLASTYLDRMQVQDSSNHWFVIRAIRLKCNSFLRLSTASRETLMRCNKDHARNWP